VPTFADSTSTDDTTYDDPIVRAAAVSALGRYNGAVVAVDPSTGRILTVVNQKLAFGEGYIPCSTIKPTIALAALEENLITRDTMLKVGRRKYMNLTDAMAHDGLTDAFDQVSMGESTERHNARLAISRAEQDEFAATNDLCPVVASAVQKDAGTQRPSRDDDRRALVSVDGSLNCSRVVGGEVALCAKIFDVVNVLDTITERPAGRSSWWCRSGCPSNCSKR
jgi:hypothetical protein